MLPWLFGCAVFSMYFASNVVQLDRQMRDSMQLAQTAQRLTSVSPAVSEDRALWLVKVQQLLPFMQDRAHDQVSVIVSRMQDLLTPGTAAYSDPVVLSAEVHSELTLLMSQLPATTTATSPAAADSAAAGGVEPAVVLGPVDLRLADDLDLAATLACRHAGYGTPAGG